MWATMMSTGCASSHKEPGGPLSFIGLTMVVSWRTVRCRTAAPYADAQFRIISQFALNISTIGSGFIKGTLENGIVSFGFGYHDFLLA